MFQFTTIKCAQQSEKSQPKYCDIYFAHLFYVIGIFLVYHIVLLWTHTHGRAKAGRPARTYIQQLCEDTGCWPEDLPEAMNDTEKWRERVRDIRVTNTTWWWWWYIYVYRLIGLVGRVFANGPGDQGSIPGLVIPKTLNMILDTSLLNTQQYKIRIEGKVEESRERSSALPDISV